MINLIKFLKVDVAIQKALLVIVCVSAPILTPLALSLPILGGWQLFSAFIIWRKTKDDLRSKYLIFSLSYILLMFGVSYFGNSQSGSKMLILFIVFIVFPIGIGMWYFVQTKNLLKDLEKKEIREIPQGMENILDSEEIFKTQ